MRIDHAIWATSDLDAAAARFEREHGLAAAGGGRHEGMGTHNRLVPLGGGYLELLAIADPEEAAASPLGRFVDAAIEGWMGWAVLVDDVDAVAERLGTEMTVIARAGFTARLTGVVEALAEPTLPFFLARDEVAGDAERLREWLGDAELPVRVRPGAPAVLAVGAGERELR
jgi:hypothetical protein